MFFQKFSVFCIFIVSLSMAQVPTDDDTVEIFKLEDDTVEGIQYLHTPFLQTLTFSPSPGDAITCNYWADSVYTVHMLSGRIHNYFQKNGQWQLERLGLSSENTRVDNLTFIGRPIADDIQSELNRAREAKSRIHLYDTKITVSRTDSLKGKDTFVLPTLAGWEHRVFRGEKLILLSKNNGRYIPFSASLTNEGKIIWSCTFQGARTEFDRFNEFFMNQTAVTLPPSN